MNLYAATHHGSENICDGRVQIQGRGRCGPQELDSCRRPQYKMQVAPSVTKCNSSSPNGSGEMKAAAEWDCHDIEILYQSGKYI